MHKKYKVKEANIFPKGIVTASVLRPKTERDHQIRLELLELRELLSSAVGGAKAKLLKRGHDLMEELRASCVVREYVQENIVCSSGLTALTKALTSNASSLDEVEINEVAVGSGTTAPDAGDTTLTTETFRNTIHSLNYASTVMYAGMFIDYTEDTGTYYEGGLFINGTGVADSGTMLNHVLLESPTGIVKTNADLLTISYQITFTSV